MSHANATATALAAVDRSAQDRATVRGADATRTIGFLRVPEPTDESQRLFDEDIADLGYVMNVSRLWAYQPATKSGLFDLLRVSNSTQRLSVRQRVILVAACASAFGDSYCSLVWGSKLAKTTDSQTAAALLRGADDGLTASEKAMVSWARKVARDPNATTAEDVQALRDAGFGDAQIFSITVFVALRLAFATVNDALGLAPDATLQSSPPAVRDAVTFGRPIADA
jgi:alkylhydroperoxidase family enzyme